MKFSDIITLAKAGYSPKDIKELLEYCETDPKVKDAELPEKVVEDIKEQEAKEEQKIVNAFEKLVNDNKEE